MAAYSGKDVRRLNRAGARRPTRLLISWAVAWAIGTGAACVWLDGDLTLRFPYAAELASVYADLQGRPVVALGSSRTNMSFEVNRLTRHLSISFPGAGLVAFNAALGHSGIPTQECVLDALLATGRRPELVIVELNPDFLNRVDRYVKPTRDITWENLVERAGDVLRGNPAGLVQNRMVPLFDRRYAVRIALWRWCCERIGRPEWKYDRSRSEVPQLLGDFVPVDPPAETLTPARRQLQAAVTYRGIHRFSPSGVGARSLERIVNKCDSLGLRVLLLEAPVCAAARRAAGPAWDAYMAHVRGLLERHPAVRYVDASGLLPDEAFSDAWHVTPHGQALFCDRFGREVLPRVFSSWLGEQPLSAAGLRPDAVSR